MGHSRKHFGRLDVADLVIVLQRPLASCLGLWGDETYRDNQRAGPWAQLLALVQVPVRLDALNLTSEPNGTASSATGVANEKGQVLGYRLSSPDWPGPRVTFFNSNTALRTLVTILETNSVPRVLVKTSPPRYCSLGRE